MQRSFFKRLIEKFIEGLLLLSGTVTSLAVVLIVIFLFREGSGLFERTPVEQGYELVLSRKNPVQKLSAEQVKAIFDQEVLTWDKLGGTRDSIIRFTINDLGKYFTDEQIGDQMQFIPQCIGRLLDSLPGVIAFIPENYVYLNHEKVLEREEGDLKIIVNKKNPVAKLSDEQLRQIKDHKVNSWSLLGDKGDSLGFDDSLVLFTEKDLLARFTAKQLSDSIAQVQLAINTLMDTVRGAIAFVPSRYILPPKSLISGFKGRVIPMDHISARSFLGGTLWFPTAQPAAQVGALPLILGTLWVSFGAILLALPLGLAAAIYMAEIAKPRVRNILKPLIELLAGIPSVVYGFFGLVVIAPLIQHLFNLPVGETALAGSIILAIMALPTIITISEDAMRTTPRAMKEASLALGATHWQTIVKVIVPYSISGITAGAILGIGRAIGETMAVLMVTGNAAVIPHSFFEPVRTIPATIAAELGETTHGGLHYTALFALGCILFIITLFINLTVEFISSKKKLQKRV
jgi:phosphate transport system permease protein